MSVWVMPSVDVYENFLKRSQAVAGGRRRSQASAQSTSSSSSCRLARASTGEGPCSFRPSSQLCDYEANPRYCTFANSWSTPCREHSTCLYLCTVLLLRLVHET